jgi:hypothetical protein
MGIEVFCECGRVLTKEEQEYIKIHRCTFFKCSLRERDERIKRENRRRMELYGSRKIRFEKD